METASAMKIPLNITERRKGYIGTGRLKGTFKPATRTYGTA
jgi:hypothetical protein